MVETESTFVCVYLLYFYKMFLFLYHSCVYSCILAYLATEANNSLKSVLGEVDYDTWPCTILVSLQVKILLKIPAPILLSNEL